VLSFLTEVHKETITTAAINRLDRALLVLILFDSVERGLLLGMVVAFVAAYLAVSHFGPAQSEEASPGGARPVSREERPAPSG
jgi:hypothetical protein